LAAPRFGPWLIILIPEWDYSQRKGPKGGQELGKEGLGIKELLLKGIR